MKPFALTCLFTGIVLIAVRAPVVATIFIVISLFSFTNRK
jgi:hypothetical protein